MVDREHDRISDRLGGILRQLREAKGLTREELAEMADVGVRHLAAIELGEKNPRINTLYRIIRALGVSADTIFYPEKNIRNNDLEHIAYLLMQCNPQQQRMIAGFVEIMLREVGP